MKLLGLRFTLADFPPDAKASALALDIMSGWKLVGPHGSHAITALEFYVNSPGHCDSANHCHPIQLVAGRWYVHTARNHESLRSPRYSGLDLTCGNSSAGIHGGILIRQLDGQGGSGVAIMKIVRGEGVGLGALPAGHPMLRWSDSEKEFLRGLQGQDAFSGKVRLKPLKKRLEGKLVAKRRVGIEGSSHDQALLHFAFR